VLLRIGHDVCRASHHRSHAHVRRGRIQRAQPRE
jgi:hypothetical protein